MNNYLNRLQIFISPKNGFAERGGRSCSLDPAFLEKTAGPEGPAG
jgi:hypothetical protein